LWEFPGGKVEPTESGAQALARELAEELGVEVLDSEPFMQVEHDYGDKSVLLDIYRVKRWVNEPRGCEGQPLAWVMPEALDDYAFPAANQPIVLRLQGAGA
jgi:8-oxo-dGTP diphosphatase